MTKFMKLIFKYLLTLLIFFSCSQNKKDLSKAYFVSTYNDSLFVDVDLNRYHTYKDLMKRIEFIRCSDSIAVLNFKDSLINKKINIYTQCEPTKWDPKLRNYIIFENGRIFKNEKEIPYRLLKEIYLKDYNNNGVDIEYAESPEKFGIIISGDENQNLKEIEIFLIDITQICDSLESKFDLNVGMFLLKPTPPPPV